MKMSLLCVAAASTILLASCSSYFSDLYIINKGRSDIADVTVAAHGTTWRLGDLPRGGIVRFSRHLEGEGAPAISWIVGGKRMTRQGCYYTGGAPERGSIVIVDTRVVYHCR